MARPRIFDQNRKAINIYLYKEQYDWLKKYCHQAGLSPSALFRKTIQQLIDSNYSIGEKK